MPIRFRCAYCKQLMSIGSRKKGTVVRCPKCSGQTVVPQQSSESGRGPASAKAGPGPTSSDAAPTPFDLSDVEILSRPGDDNPFEFGSEDGMPQTPITGVFLTSKHLVFAGALIFLLLVAAFVVGWFLGRG